MADFRSHDTSAIWNSSDWSLRAGWILGIRIRISYLFLAYVLFVLMRDAVLAGGGASPFCATRFPGR